MLTPVKFCTAIFIIFTMTKLASTAVQSCYACAGPQSDCVSNNRTDFLKMDCDTFLVEGASLASRTLEPQLLEKFDSEVGPRMQDSEIGCLTVTYNKPTENPPERALKTCIPAKIFNEDVCDYMESLITFSGGEQTSCHFCKKDDCNSAILLGSVARIIVFGACLIYFTTYFLL